MHYGAWRSACFPASLDQHEQAPDTPKLCKAFRIIIATVTPRLWCGNKRRDNDFVLLKCLFQLLGRRLQPRWRQQPCSTNILPFAALRSCSLNPS